MLVHSKKTLLSLMGDLCPGDLVMTGSKRLQREIHTFIHELRAGKGHSVWKDDIAVKTFDGYVEQSWLETWPELQLMHPVQELMAFKKVLDDNYTGELSSRMGVARKLRKADQLVSQYQLPVTQDILTHDETADRFIVWKALFDQMAVENNWLPSYRIIDDLITRLDEEGIDLPRRIFVCGIIDLTPQQENFLEVLASYGVSVEVVELESYVSSSESFIQMYRPATIDEEYRQIAAWAAERLDDYIGNEAEAPRLAVVVPDHDQAKQRLNAVFTEYLSPHVLFKNEDYSEPANMYRRPWTFSMGEPLSEAPVVDRALSVLLLTLKDNHYSQITDLLLNPYIGNWGVDSVERSQYDLFLRQYAKRLLPITDIRRFMDHKRSTGLPEGFAKQLEYIERFTADESYLLPSQWSGVFATFLESIGWPGKALSNNDQQALKAYDECVAIFNSLDDIKGEVDRIAAVKWFREVLADRLFQPAKPYYSPVQVLTYSEVIGLNFDEAWVMGLSSSVLPKAEDPNPFVEVDLQRAKKVPLSSAEIELERAEHLIDHMKGIAIEVIFSCPVTNEDGSAVAPSSLIDGWADESLAYPGSAFKSFVETVISQGDQRVDKESDEVPPVSAGELANIKGGEGIFVDYARSPFFAFAKRRLGMTEFAKPTAGLESRTQGTVGHAVLESFWNQIKTKSALLKLSDQELTSLLVRLIDQSLEENDVVSDRYSKALVRLERERLFELLRSWVEVEKQRDEDFEVIATEQSVRVNIAGLPLRLVRDRVDTVKTDHGDVTVIIDYKFGEEVKPSNWDVGPIKSPQLPIYSIISESRNENVEGISFAHVHAKNPSFYLRSSWTDTLASKVKGKKFRSSYSVSSESWNAQNEKWREELEESATLFLSGFVDYFYDRNTDTRYYEYLQPFTRDHLRR